MVLERMKGMDAFGNCVGGRVKLPGEELGVGSKEREAARLTHIILPWKAENPRQEGVRSKQTQAIVCFVWDKCGCEMPVKTQVEYSMVYTSVGMCGLQAFRSGERADRTGPQTGQR